MALDTVLEHLFILDDVSIKSSGAGAVIMSNARTRKVIEIQAIMSNLIGHCDRFRTLDHHLAHISERLNLPHNIQNELRQTLLLLKQHGMLLAAVDVKKKITPTNEPLPSTRTIPWVLGIHSCDRPHSLALLLSSAIQHLNDLDSKPQLIFIDDSREKENQLKNKAILTTFCTSTGLILNYWDRAQRSQFSLNLAKKIPQHSRSIHWLIDPNSHSVEANSTGLAKNFMLLHTINKNLIMLDDDCLTTPYRMPHCQLNTSLQFNEDKFFAFSNDDELQEKIQELSINPFEEHLAALNGRIVDNFKNNNAEDSAIWKEMHRDQALQLNEKSHIGMTVNSIVGTLNTRHISAFYSHSQHADQLELFLQKNNESNQLTQLFWCGPAQQTVNKLINFTCTTMSGIKACSIPAPSIPIGRGQDSFLGGMYAYLYPNTHTTIFDWALKHSPTPKRTWNPSEQPTFQTYRAIDVLRKILIHCHTTCGQSTFEKRMAYYLNTLQEWALCSDSQLKIHLKNMISTAATQSIQAWTETRCSVNDYPLYRNGSETIINGKKSELVSLFNDISTLKDDFLALATPIIPAFKDWPAIIDFVQSGNFLDTKTSGENI